MEDRDWYKKLDMTIRVPGPVFGIVWPILYICIIISTLMMTVFRGPARLDWKTTKWIFINIFVNVIWMPIFQTSRLGIKIAFLDILVIDYTCFKAIKEFHKINPTAAYLLIPYMLWISFATFLNFDIMVRNW
ncbi:hypothetical protein PCE1_002302 [Barthelona sp. PCE]